MTDAPRPSIANAPIFEMPKYLRIWRRVRWPVFISTVVIILLTVAGITRSLVVAKNIAKTIREAHSAEVAGTVKAMQVAEGILARLVEKQSWSDEAQAAWAWQVLVQAILWGYEGWSEKVEDAVDTIEGSEGELTFAAEAAWAYLKGDPKRALEVASSGLAKHRESERLKMMRLLALNALGRKEEARDVYATALASTVDYVPLLIAAVTVEMENANRLEALELSTRLLKASPGNLYALLALIRMELPNWADPDPSLKDIALLHKRLEDLAPRLADAPPKLATLGYYLKGRIALLTGDSAAAIKSLEQNLKGNPTSDSLAWCAVAVWRSSDCDHALSFLNDHAPIKGDEVLDVRAQCLLEYHRVHLAKDVIDKLASTAALPDRVRTLRWLLAIRSGNISQTKARIPKKISAADQLAAVETYFLLKHEGDTAGIKQLIQAMEPELSDCAKSIRVWHNRNLRRAFKLWSRSGPESACDAALMARLMRGHADPAAVKAAADQVKKAARTGLSFEVDRALAVWRTEGYDSALAILDKLSGQHLQGGPIRAALARAYLDMAVPEKALAVLEDAEGPELFALRVFALRAAGKKGAAGKLEQRAVKRSRKINHPALTYFYLKSRIEAGDAAAVTSWIEENMSDSYPGEWTSEITELGAQALNLVEERVEAEDFIQKVARKVSTWAGSDESLDTWKAQLRLNFKRVGKFRNRALTVAMLLTSDGVRDPDLGWWLALENIQGGSERVGLRILKEILDIDPAFKPAWEKMAEMGWLTEERTATMKSIWPSIEIPDQ